MLHFLVAVSKSRRRRLKKPTVGVLSAKTCVSMKDAADHLMWLSPRQSIAFAGWSDRVGDDVWRRDAGGLVAVGGSPVIAGDGGVSGTSLLDRMCDRSRSLVSLAFDLDGLYGLVRVDGPGRTEIINDPYGVHTIYTAETSSTRIFSNRPSLVAAVIEAERGRAVEPDADALAMVVAMGHVIGDVTSYQGVSTLPFGCGVSIDESCKVEITKSRPDPWATEIHPDGPSPAEIDQLEARMVAFARSVLSAHPDTTIAELTAGRDSRLVLGILARAGILDDITFFIRGPEQSRDFEGAATIADRLGLNFVRATWHIPVDGYTSFYEAHVERVSGQLGCWESSAPRQPNHATLAGMFGETTRAYTETSGATSVDQLVRDFRAYHNKRAGPLRPEVLQRTLETVAETMLEPLQEGCRFEDLGDIYFSKQRTRRLLGVQMERHIGYFYPLYVQGLSRTAFKWGPDARLGDRIRIALMERSNLGLDDLEFDKAGKNFVPDMKRSTSSRRYPMASFSETREQSKKRLRDRVPSRQEALGHLLSTAKDSAGFEIVDRDVLYGMLDNYSNLTVMERIKMHWALSPVLFMRDGR